jgi:DNA repair exonuclease SbcCD ATPase subunit
MKKTICFCLLAVLASPFFAAAQTATTDNMTLAALDEKMESLGQEMEKLGEVMEGYGLEMEKQSKELEDSEGQSSSAQKRMEALGEKMNELGEQMGKLGEIMGQYGEKMGETHQQMMTWFFQELKKDGLIASLNGKARIIFDEKGLNVDGENASSALFNKYKSGFEKYWGKPLKTDFSLFFKGTIKEKNGKIETDGNMNSDF